MLSGGCPLRGGGYAGSWSWSRHIYAKVSAGALRARPTRVFRFDEIVEAHQAMEAGEALGKMVVTLG
ncbi:zinc-binding dehydrogenase [Streptomyces sp. WM6378]|uniref:zinc-binding dehydrogenase n=1 Tax=Streptomyces sp. WM6378 TaxID=1415557 RepID=UPI0006ADE6BE|nr:zinc-binding dehydrogenase [Streptomyces sp. WM6378]KOU37823.1 hypothetical protein ADK54_30900 [Streptomyces sp. WM6378]